MSTATSSHDALLRQLKEISGRRIEGERRRRFLTQQQFASRLGISVRWLREVESGNPVVKMDDHLLCAAALGLAPSYIFLPLLYGAHGRRFPIDISYFDLTDVEYRCMQLIDRRTKQAASLPRPHATRL
jgi:Predicted transcriptional regulator